MNLRSAARLDEVVEKPHRMPAELAAEGGAVDTVVLERGADLLQLVIALRDAEPILVEDVRTIPEAHASGIVGDAVDPAIAGDALDRPRGEAILPAILLVVRRELEDLTGIDERARDLAAPHEVDIRRVAGGHRRAQDVGVDRSATAGDGLELYRDVGMGRMEVREDRLPELHPGAVEVREEAQLDLVLRRDRHRRQQGKCRACTPSAYAAHRFSASPFLVGIRASGGPRLDSLASRWRY